MAGPYGPPPKASVKAFAAVAADVNGAVLPAEGGANIRLMGWHVRSSAAATAVIIKNAATGAGGTALVHVGVEASKEDGEWYGPNGLDANLGISISFGAGAPDIDIYWASL